MNNIDFIDFLSGQEDAIFLEAEAKPDKMERFINDYNNRYTPHIDFSTNGVCTLGRNVDKWGVELRVYLNDVSGIPPYWADRVYRNRKYRADEFAYRIDDNTLVYELFDSGYRIGYN
jgi:hypothetical protein